MKAGNSRAFAWPRIKKILESLERDRQNTGISIAWHMKSEGLQRRDERCTIFSKDSGQINLEIYYTLGALTQTAGMILEHDAFQLKKLLMDAGVAVKILENIDHARI